MLISSERFGEFEVEEATILTFKFGIPGFDDTKEYILLPSDVSNNIFWLQSLKQPNLSMCLIDIETVMPQYSPEIPKFVFNELKMQSLVDIKCFAIINVQNDISTMTANLAAPLVINTSNNLAKQVILEESPYYTKYPVYQYIEEYATV